MTDAVNHPIALWLERPAVATLLSEGADDAAQANLSRIGQELAALAEAPFQVPIPADDALDPFEHAMVAWIGGALKVGGLLDEYDTLPERTARLPLLASVRAELVDPEGMGIFNDMAIGVDPEHPESAQLRALTDRLSRLVDAENLRVSEEAIDIGSPSVGYRAWLPAEYLADYWHAEAFRPELLELEEWLQNNAESVMPVDDVAEVAPTHVIDRGALRVNHWLVRPRAQGLEVVPAAEVKGAGPLRLVPDGALVLGPLMERKVLVAYWSDEAVGGFGVTSASNVILVPRTSEPIGWLAEQLRLSMAVGQLRRVATGAVVSRIAAHDVLRVRVDRLTPDQRRALNARAVASLTRTAAYGKARRLFSEALAVTRTFVLTASTFDERLAQFERQLTDSGLVEPEDVHFVEAATSQRSSDLFVVRSVDRAGRSRSSEVATTVRIQDEPGVDREWRDWYWDTGDDTTFDVFNTLTAELSLPSHLVARMTVRPRRATEIARGPVLLPSFLNYRAAVESHRGDAVDIDEVVRELSELWARLNSHEADSASIADYLHSVYRPVLALKVRRDGTTAGVYMLSGPPQLAEPEPALGELSALGLRLSEILRLPDQLVDDAARRESLNRLSKLMHGLNGPLGRIGGYLSDMKEFLETNAAMGELFVPSEDAAEKRAAMNRCSVEDYSFRARLAQLERAWDEMQLFQRQLREFRNVQGDLRLSLCMVGEIMERLGADAREQLPGIGVQVDLERSLSVVVDGERLEAALRQVINNACRELKRRAVASPRITLSASSSVQALVLSVSDNALPQDVALIADPFDEDASAYRRSGEGTGLGLAIVREAVRSHGGHCRLDENIDSDGNRLPGVTFTAEIPLREPRHGA